MAAPAPSRRRAEGDIAAALPSQPGLGGPHPAPQRAPAGGRGTLGPRRGEEKRGGGRDARGAGCERLGVSVRSPARGGGAGPPPARVLHSSPCPPQPAADPLTALPKRGGGRAARRTGRSRPPPAPAVPPGSSRADSWGMRGGHPPDPSPCPPRRRRAPRRPSARSPPVPPALTGGWGRRGGDPGDPRPEPERSAPRNGRRRCRDRGRCGAGRASSPEPLRPPRPSAAPGPLPPPPGPRGWASSAGEGSEPGRGLPAPSLPGAGARSPGGGQGAPGRRARHRGARGSAGPRGSWGGSARSPRGIWGGESPGDAWEACPRVEGCGVHRASPGVGGKGDPTNGKLGCPRSQGRLVGMGWGLGGVQPPGCLLGAQGCSEPDPAPPTAGSRQHVSCFGSDRAL